MEYVFNVAMSCEGCSGAVTRALQKNECVTNIVCSIPEQKVTVESTLPQQEVLEIIQKTGKPVSAAV